MQSLRGILICTRANHVAESKKTKQNKGQELIVVKTELIRQTHLSHALVCVCVCFATYYRAPACARPATETHRAAVEPSGI